MSAKPTAAQIKALLTLQQGLSLRGRSHATTYRILKANGWIEDADTITVAGLQVIATQKAARPPRECPDLPKGRECPLCKGQFTCLKPELPKRLRT